mmetsp:Transcript_22908/g.38733  ORF Transcript_22908/g.38733 Transcript_22908/m.38733 type:complete len:214 (+) Transcript_22908:167-808(+)
MRRACCIFALIFAVRRLRQKAADVGAEIGNYHLRSPKCSCLGLASGFSLPGGTAGKAPTLDNPSNGLLGPFSEHASGFESNWPIARGSNGFPVSTSTGALSGSSSSPSTVDLEDRSPACFAAGLQISVAPMESTSLSIGVAIVSSGAPRSLLCTWVPPLGGGRMGTATPVTGMSAGTSCVSASRKSRKSGILACSSAPSLRAESCVFVSGGVD